MVLESAFARQFEKNIRNTIRKFDLISVDDKLLVAVSGGKDSTAILYVLKKLGYAVEAITIDVLIGNYTKQNLKNIKEFCKEQDIKLHIVSFREAYGSSLCHIVSLIKSKGWNLQSCTVCGVLRRYLVNFYARKLKAGKVVTGHNLDDEAQTFMMNLFKNKKEMNARLGPCPGIIRDSKFVPRIKPLYLTSEKDIEKYSKEMKFPVKYGRCPCAIDAYRNYIRNMLDNLEKDYPNIKQNIVKYLLNNLDQWKKEVLKQKGKLNACKKCKEPSRSEVCRACQLLGFVKKPN
ncbi:TIGR00269 family protein [Candidatus Woesearchaeota archaeon]|nr:TIGR00269 family protein [Candidatus Woesearchaeota archaeon]